MKILGEQISVDWFKWVAPSDDQVQLQPTSLGNYAPSKSYNGSLKDFPQLDIFPLEELQRL